MPGPEGQPDAVTAQRADQTMDIDTPIGHDGQVVVGNNTKPVDFKYVSGLEYKRHERWNFLKIAPERAWMERHYGILGELNVMLGLNEPANVVFLDKNSDTPQSRFMRHHLTELKLLAPGSKGDILYSLHSVSLEVAAKSEARFMLLPDDGRKAYPRFLKFRLSVVGTDPPAYALFVALPEASRFREYFRLELKGYEFTYDNLVNLCVMVKNGGPLFATMLRDNLPYIDRWTIMDTGSTDGTLDTIQEVLVGKKRGTLYTEPFVNFRESRNRCLDLGGTHCKYNVMLDDTYVIRGDIRKFLEEVRGDEFSSSFSLYVTSDDVEYTSNRITRVDLNLRYIFKIHEVIQKDDNVNVVIPKEMAYIDDMRAEYMEERTMDRKKLDLKWLHESLEEDPTEPRHLYYLAQTYNLVKDYVNAEKYFRLRTFCPHDGFVQEQADACFELARVMQFQLGKPWHEVEPIYLKVLELEPRRCDAMYFLGIYHIYDGRHDEPRAYEWFVRAFPIGYPTDTQYSLKPTLVFYYLPSFLAPMCYTRNNWDMGLAACERFLGALSMPAVKAVIQTQVVEQTASWHAIYKRLVKLPQNLPAFRVPLDLLFIVDGNWTSWTGSDIETKGLGGSETWAVEMATQMAAWLPRDSRCVFLCKTEAPSVYKGVEFLPIDDVESFLISHKVKVCIVSRFSEYVPLAVQSGAEEVHLVLHDTGPVGNIIVNDPALRSVVCLSPWHSALIIQTFNGLKDKVKTLGYGIDSEVRYVPREKKRHSFVFSSFPNRGLKELLEMWPRVKAALPDATLEVFCNLQHEFVRRVSAEYMAEVDRLLLLMEGVTVRGWVSKPELAEAYGKADYWLYPCVFEETFCLTALEAVSCGAVGIAPPLAALQHMPLCFVEGDAKTREWADAALATILRFEAQPKLKQQYRTNGLQFAMERSWFRQAALFLQQTSLFKHSKVPRTVVRKFWYTPREVSFYVNESGCGKLLRVVRHEGDSVGLEYTYMPHLMQRASNPVQLFNTVTTKSQEGLIETPSPLIEVLRGVDPLSKTLPGLRGYSSHSWLIWTELEDNSLHMLPKLGLLEHMPVSKRQEREWATVANTHPVLWNNYYEWSSRKAAKLVVHMLEFDSYFALVERAIEQSIAWTRKLFPESASLGNMYYGGPEFVGPAFMSIEQHLSRMSVARSSIVGEGTAMWNKLKAMRDSGFMPKVIYDIGACVLEWTFAARTIWPEARILVFDAMRSLESLYKEHGLDYHIGVLSDVDGKEVRFYQNEMLPFGNSYYREVGTAGSEELFPEERSVVMRTRALDTVVKELDVPQPDLIKIDVQGSEGDVIRGALATLRKTSRIIVELQDSGYNEGAPAASVVKRWLEEVGFQCTDAKFADNSADWTNDYEFVNTRLGATRL